MELFAHAFILRQAQNAPPAEPKRRWWSRRRD
jgi:hypothetical protein